LSNLRGSGILGMSPYDESDSRGDLFILKMKKANVIDQSVFSLYINLKNNTSKITFGGYNLNKYASNLY
jgi:cell division protein YceG involved in septum cleavage